MRFAAQCAMLEEQATEETKSLDFLRMFGLLQVRSSISGSQKTDRIMTDLEGLKGLVIG